MSTASKIVMAQGDAPLTPPTNTSIIYVKSDGKFYTKDPAGVETLLGNPEIVLASTITDADTTHAPDGNSVFDALALKSDTNHTHEAVSSYSTVFYGVRR